MASWGQNPDAMSQLADIFAVRSVAGALPLAFALVLLLILVVSFRSRAMVFCQYLEMMTGIVLKPSEVNRVYAERGRQGVRDLFLDLIIREDLKSGPPSIPDHASRPGA